MASLDSLPIAVALFDASGSLRVTHGGLRGLLDATVPSRAVEKAAEWQFFDSSGQLLPKVSWPDERALSGASPSGSGVALHRSASGGERAIRVLVMPPARSNGAGGGILLLEDPAWEFHHEIDPHAMLTALLGAATAPGDADARPPALSRLETDPDNSDGSGLLTEREQQVFALVGWGISNKDIAHLLRIHVKTVEAHRARAMRKLGLHQRYEVTRYALDHGWLKDLPMDMLDQLGNPP